MRNPVCVLGCLYVWVVRGYCHTDNACLVSVRAFYCIFTVPSPAASFCRYQACVPTRDRHRATQAHPLSNKVIAGWCYGDPTRYTLPRTYLLSDSHHSLQLRPSIPECNDLSQFKEDTGGPSVPVREINLIAYLPVVQPTDNSCRDPDLIPGPCRLPAS